MAKKSTIKPRRRTIPVLPWWTDAVRRQLKSRNMNQEQLAAATGHSPTEITRALNGEMPVIDVVQDISTELGIAFPVFLPASEREAEHLAQQGRLIRRDIELDVIKAGVGDRRADDQPPSVQSRDAVKERARKQPRARPG